MPYLYNEGRMYAYLEIVKRTIRSNLNTGRINPIFFFQNYYLWVYLNRRF